MCVCLNGETRDECGAERCEEEVEQVAGVGERGVRHGREGVHDARTAQLPQRIGAGPAQRVAPHRALRHTRTGGTQRREGEGMQQAGQGPTEPRVAHGQVLHTQGRKQHRRLAPRYEVEAGTRPQGAHPRREEQHPRATYRAVRVQVVGSAVGCAVHNGTKAAEQGAGYNTGLPVFGGKGGVVEVGKEEPRRGRGSLGGYFGNGSP